MTESADPLTRAIELSIEFESRQGDKDLDTFLSEHEDLRDILEPLLRKDAAPDQRPVLGDFELVRELGRGGMGVVYEAIQRMLGRTVALKLLPPHRSLSPRSLAMFRREATLAASLDHPGIAKVLELQEVDGQLALAMELIDGLPLDDILHSLEGEDPGSLSAADFARAAGVAVEGDDVPVEWSGSYVRTGVELARQTAEALAHANSRGVVHRDVKPGNILITPEGRAVLTDFGLAREEGMLGVTQTGEFAGTYQYAAPEQLEGRIDELDGRTDVYALGATLYEMLTLHRPLEADSLTELVQRIQREDPARPSKVNPHVSRDLDAVVMCALEKDRRARYASAEELAIDLSHVLAGRPVKARRLSATVRAVRWTKRNPLVSAMVVVLVVATAAVSLFSLQAKASLARFENVWVGAALDSLEARAARAHPAWPENHEMLRDLVLAAEDLLRMRDEHREAIAALRGGHSAGREETRAVGRAAHPAEARLVEIRGEIRRLSEEKTRPGVNEAAQRIADVELATLRAEEERLVELETDSMYVRIPDAAEQALHDRLEHQLYRLDRLEKGLLADLRFRRDWAANIRTMTVDAFASEWQAASRRVAEDARFGDFTLSPQTGLVPLGPDPESGLEEFAHALSGEIPKRNDGGALKLGDAHGIVLVLLPRTTYHLDHWKVDRRRPEKKDWEVTIDPFFIGKYELGRAQWRRLARGIPELRWRDGGIADVRNLGELHKPVNGVTWTMCQKLFERSGLELPTAGQWEAAALFEDGIDADALPKAANLLDQDYAAARGIPKGRALPFHDGHVGLAPTYSMAATPAGLHHMHGNVSEWCRDVFSGDIRPRDGDGLRDAWAGKFALRTISGGHWQLTKPLNFLDRRNPDSATRSVGVRASRRLVRQGER